MRVKIIIIIIIIIIMIIIIIIIRGQPKIFNWSVKLNWKTALRKEKTNQKNKDQVEKN